MVIGNCVISELPPQRYATFLYIDKDMDQFFKVLQKEVKGI
jgi:hypothetical protein